MIERCQKLEPFLLNKPWMKLTMSLMKVVLLTQYSKFLEDKVDFRPWKLAPKTKSSRFLKALNQTVLQDIKKPFEDVHLDAKVYRISSASQWDSTTVIMLLLTIWTRVHLMSILIGCVMVSKHAMYKIWRKTCMIFYVRVGKKFTLENVWENNNKYNFY